MRGNFAIRVVEAPRGFVDDAEPDRSVRIETVDKYASDVALLKRKLQAPDHVVTDVLRRLQQIGVVDLQNGKYRVLKDNLHLASDSPLYKAYRTSMRIKTLHQIENLPAEKAYNFSVVFSTSPEARQRVHEAFLAFLKEAQATVGSSRPQEVYQMNFDLFTWSE